MIKSFTKNSVAFEQLMLLPSRVARVCALPWNKNTKAINTTSVDVITKMEATARELGLPEPIVLDRQTIFSLYSDDANRQYGIESKIENLAPKDSFLKKALQFERHFNYGDSGKWHQHLSSLANVLLGYLSDKRNCFFLHYDVPFIVLGRNESTNPRSFLSLSQDDIARHEFNHYFQIRALNNIKGWEDVPDEPPDDEPLYAQDKWLHPQSIKYIQKKQTEELHSDVLLMFGQCQESRLNDLRKCLQSRAGRFSDHMKALSETEERVKTDDLAGVMKYAHLFGLLETEKFIDNVKNKAWKDADETLVEVFDCNGDYVSPKSRYAKRISKKLRRKGFNGLDFEEASDLAAAMTAKYRMNNFQLRCMHDHIRDLAFGRVSPSDAIPQEKNVFPAVNAFWDQFAQAFDVGMKRVELIDTVARHKEIQDEIGALFPSKKSVNRQSGPQL